MSQRHRASTNTTSNPEMKVGKALDLMIEKVEAWAKSYKWPDQPEKWEPAFEQKFQPEAQILARRSTATPRRFEAKDWVLGIVLWGIIAACVWVFSFFVMQLDEMWPWVFAAFAVLIAAVGIWQSYQEVTSEKRAADKLAKNEQWLLGVSRKTVARVMATRIAKRERDAR